MSDTIKTLQDLAEKLGAGIGESEAFTKYRDVHERLRKDEEAKKLLDDHQKVFIKVRQLEQEGKPVEVADKHALRDAQEKLHANELLQQYAAAQADFQDLMNRVTAGIHHHIHLDPIWDDDGQGGEEEE